MKKSELRALVAKLTPLQPGYFDVPGEPRSVRHLAKAGDPKTVCGASTRQLRGHPTPVDVGGLRVVRTVEDCERCHKKR